MSYMLLAGIIAVILGLVVLIWPFLLNFIVAIALILWGIWAIYVGTTGRRLI